jgi:hypothetical protein
VKSDDGLCGKVLELKRSCGIFLEVGGKMKTSVETLKG